jgi:hypothetical protein
MSQSSPLIEKKKDWRRPIIFEGVELPLSAIAIDHLGMYGNLPDMSEPTSEFLWRFTVCVGRPLTVESEVVIRHCSEALALAESSRERLIVTVPAHWDGPFDSSVVDEWISALRTILSIAATRPQCTWEAPLRPDDQNYGRPLAEVHSEMLGRMQKCFDRAQKRPWWKRLFS